MPPKNVFVICCLIRKRGVRKKTRFHLLLIFFSFFFTTTIKIFLFFILIQEMSEDITPNLTREKSIRSYSQCLGVSFNFNLLPSPGLKTCGVDNYKSRGRNRRNHKFFFLLMGILNNDYY